MEFCEYGKKIFYAGGLDPTNSKPKCFRFTWFIFVILVQTYQVLCDIAAVVFLKQSIVVKLETFEHAVLHISAMIKTLYIYYNAEQFLMLWCQLDYMYENFESKFTIRKNLSLSVPERITTTLNKVFVFSVAIMISLCVLTPFVRSNSEHRALPVDSNTYFFYDVQSSPNYEITCVFQLVYAIFCIYYGNMCWWAQLLTLAIHANHKFYVLKYLLQNIKYSNSINTNRRQPSKMLQILTKENIEKKALASGLPKHYFDEVSPGGSAFSDINELREANKALKNIIMYHAAVLRFCEDIRKLSSFCILLDMLTNVSIFCAIVYVIAKVHVSEAGLMIFVALVTVSVMFLQCWMSTQLNAQSIAVATGAYDCELVTESEFRKSLSVLIARAQRPFSLTMGPFGVIDLNTFVSVLQLTYSNYMFLREMEKTSEH